MKKHSVRVSGKNKWKVAIDLSGLDEASRRNLEKTLKTEQKVVNMNYPPSDVSQEELERFWGEPSPKEDEAWVKRMRAIKVKKRNQPSAHM